MREKFGPISGIPEKLRIEESLEVMYIDFFARRFAEAGVAALLFD